MPIPDYETLMLPLLFEAAKGKVGMKEVIARLADRYELTPEERAMMIPSGKTGLLSNRAHWAKTYLKKAGLVEQPARGVIAITKRGEEALSRAPAKIDGAFLSQFEEFKAFVTPKSGGTPQAQSTAAHTPPAQEVASTPEEAIEEAQTLLETALAGELLDKLRVLSPAGFERFVIEFLLALGYGGSQPDAAEAIGKSGDDGVDGVVYEDKLGLDRIYVQAKRWSGAHSVSAGDIRGFYGSLEMQKATKGLFVTTSTFTTSAQSTAKAMGKRIVLLDGEALTRLMVEHSVGCALKSSVKIQRLDESFFDDLDQ